MDAEVSFKLFELTQEFVLDKTKARAFVSLIEQTVENKLESKKDILATKADIAMLELKIAEVNAHITESKHGLEFKIAEVNTKLEAKIAEVNTKLEAKIAEVNTKLEAKIAEVNTRITESKHDLEFKIAEVNTKLEAKIAESKADLEFKIAEVCGKLETKIAEGKSETIKWMFIFWAGQILIMLAMVGFLLKK